VIGCCAANVITEAGASAAVTVGVNGIKNVVPVDRTIARLRDTWAKRFGTFMLRYVTPLPKFDFFSL
jgi:hypothetical protein